MVSAALFPDVPQGAWYEKELEMMLTYTPGIISGYPDGTFKPGDIIKRGEFLTMMARAAELITMTPAPSDHWAAPYWQACYENGVLLLDAEKQELVFGCTADELNVPINRYEMAVIVANITLVGNARESRVTVTDADKYIPDYNNIPDKYKDAVEQTYGKGIINGYSDGSFRGDRTLTRCEAMVAHIVSCGQAREKCLNLRTRMK